MKHIENETKSVKNNNIQEEKVMMKRASYSEAVLKSIIKDIKAGATMEDITSKYNVRTRSTVKGWLDRFYTVKKKLVQDVYYRLVENDRKHQQEMASVEESDSVDENLVAVTTEQEVQTEVAEESNVEAVPESTCRNENIHVNSCDMNPAVLDDLKRALNANRQMNFTASGRTPDVLIDGNILFEGIQEPETAVKLLTAVVDSLVLLGRKNRFVWHREIMSSCYNASSEMVRAACAVVLKYGDFFPKYYKFHHDEFSIISNRTYKVFKEVLNPLNVANISIEEQLFSEFNHSETFSLQEKKSGWVGIEEVVRREFIKKVSLDESEGWLKISCCQNGYFFVKEGEEVTFEWESKNDEIEVWRYYFKGGRFYDVGHRKAAKSAKALIAV